MDSVVWENVDDAWANNSATRSLDFPQKATTLDKGGGPPPRGGGGGIPFPSTAREAQPSTPTPHDDDSSYRQPYGRNPSGRKQLPRKITRLSK
ncbi:hypothetical protein L484_026883 [Morus notabilis]|uniref:Uncharacterized protein n=1 Tax=Morus notabilis TaxID=981085 RepID=W9RE73_9ROSA|nr:hypothetical protein L484_026883 [Morus notabilis]